MSFFFRMVRDARSDPFFPCPWPVAVWFVLCHWSWLRRQEAAGWPLPSV